MSDPVRSALAPCPFCGSEDIDPSGMLRCDDDGEGDAATCNACGACGPYMDDNPEASATDLWNRRAALSAAPVQDADLTVGQRNGLAAAAQGALVAAAGKGARWADQYAFDLTDPHTKLFVTCSNWMDRAERADRLIDELRDELSLAQVKADEANEALQAQMKWADHLLKSAVDAKTLKRAAEDRADRAEASVRAADARVVELEKALRTILAKCEGDDDAEGIAFDVANLAYQALAERDPRIAEGAARAQVTLPEQGK